MWNKLANNGRNIAEFFDALASVATVLGVVGLFFVYKQLQANEEEIAINTMGQVYGQMVEIDKVFMDHPESRLYIYYNLRPEDINPYADIAQRRLDQARAETAAELMLDFFSQVVLVQSKLGSADEGWKRYIKDIYKCSPVLRERYDRKIEWYKNEAAATIIEQAKNELMQGGAVQCDGIEPPKP